jgi:CBS domain-containing protein
MQVLPDDRRRESRRTHGRPPRLLFQILYPPSNQEATMQCLDILRVPLEYVSPDDPVRLAAMKMRESNIGFLPVCEADLVVIGVITDRDLALRIVAEGKPSSTRVRDAMTSEDIITCLTDDDLEEAGSLMRQHAIGRVVVTDRSGRAIGVVSLADIVRNMTEEDSTTTMVEVTDREVATPSP